MAGFGGSFCSGCTLTPWRRGSQEWGPSPSSALESWSWFWLFLLMLGKVVSAELLAKAAVLLLNLNIPGSVPACSSQGKALTRVSAVFDPPLVPVPLPFTQGLFSP